MIKVVSGSRIDLFFFKHPIDSCICGCTRLGVRHSYHITVTVTTVVVVSVVGIVVEIVVAMVMSSATALVIASVIVLLK